jgi:hypothetical protein
VLYTSSDAMMYTFMLEHIRPLCTLAFETPTSHNHSLEMKFVRKCNFYFYFFPKPLAPIQQTLNVYWSLFIRNKAITAWSWLFAYLLSFSAAKNEWNSTSTPKYSFTVFKRKYLAFPPLNNKFCTFVLWDLGHMFLSADLLLYINSFPSFTFLKITAYNGCLRTAETCSYLDLV